jgi:hypothetical protein
MVAMTRVNPVGRDAVDLSTDYKRSSSNHPDGRDHHINYRGWLRAMAEAVLYAIESLVLRAISTWIGVLPGRQ